MPSGSAKVLDTPRRADPGRPRRASAAICGADVGVRLLRDLVSPVACGSDEIEAVGAETPEQAPQPLADLHRRLARPGHVDRPAIDAEAEFGSAVVGRMRAEQQLARRVIGVRPEPERAGIGDGIAEQLARMARIGRLERRCLVQRREVHLQLRLVELAEERVLHAETVDIDQESRERAAAGTRPARQENHAAAGLEQPGMHQAGVQGMPGQPPHPALRRLRRGDRVVPAPLGLELLAAVCLGGAAMDDG